MNVSVDIGKWKNPFEEIFDWATAIILYEAYLRNNDELFDYPEDLINTTFTTILDFTKRWTPAEVIIKLLCERRILNSVCVVYRHLLHNPAGIIVNNVSCDKKPTSKISTEVHYKYPKSHDYFINSKSRWEPGMIQLVPVYGYSPKLFICNLAGQRESIPDGNPDYRAIRSALYKLKKISTTLNLPVFIPWNMGCESNLVDWNVYLNIIRDEIPNAIICKDEIPHNYNFLTE